MKTATNNIRIVILQCVGLILSGCTIFGYAPISVGYFSALYSVGNAKAITVLTTLLGMYYSMDIVSFVKYSMVIAMLVGITALYEGSKKEKISSYKSCILTILSMGIMEMTDIYVSLNRDMNTYIMLAGVCVLSGAIMIVFARGIEGALNISMERDIQNEEMIGITVISGICFYYLVTTVNVPYSIMETVIVLMVLFFSYKYGAGMGAIAGAGFGIAMGIELDRVEIVSVMCISAIAAGGMRELGRIASALAMICTIISGSLLLVPDIVDTTSIQGILAGTIIFLVLPRMLVYRCRYDEEYIEGRRDTEQLRISVREKIQTLGFAVEVLYDSIQEEKEIETKSDRCSEIKNIVNDVCGECAKCGKCLDKQRVVSGFVKKEKLDIEDKGNCPYISKIENEIRFMDERRRSDDIWKKRFNHLRENINIQLEELSSLVKEDLPQSEKTNFIFGKLYRRLRSKNVTLLEIQMRESESGSDEIDITVKCDSGKTITVKEVAMVLSEVVGKKMEPEKNDSIIIGENYKTIFFRQTKNFSINFGVAKSVKDGGNISGDNQSIVDIGNGKWLITLADGMGTGENACKESENITELIGDMLKSGFSRESTVRLVNSISSMNWKKECTTSVDMGVIDMYSGVCNLLKMGGASTFIKRKSWVDVMKSTSMPIGIMDRVDVDSATKKLYDGDKIVLVSDGILEGIDSEDAEHEISRIMFENSNDNPDELANRILNRAMEDSFYIPGDDMTVVVAQINENYKSA